MDETMRLAETRPCALCEGSGVELYDEGPEHPPAECRCRDCGGSGDLPRDLSVALEVLGRVRSYAAGPHAGPSPRWVADQITPWARAKYGKGANDA